MSRSSPSRPSPTPTRLHRPGLRAEGQGRRVRPARYGPQQTAGLVGTSAQLGYEPTWVASSGAWYVALATPLKGLLDKFYVSAGYGTEVDKVKGVEDLNAAIAKYSPDSKPTNFMIAGWLFGIATVDALEAACDSKDLTREASPPPSRT